MPFDLGLLRDLEGGAGGGLNVTWRTCPEYNSSHMKFWGHEWVAHGTCSGLGEHGYFALGQRLFRENVADCPTEANAKSCWFCFDAQSLRRLNKTSCHFSGR